MVNLIKEDDQVSVVVVCVCVNVYVDVDVIIMILITLILILNYITITTTTTTTITGKPWDPSVLAKPEQMTPTPVVDLLAEVNKDQTVNKPGSDESVAKSLKRAALQDYLNQVNRCVSVTVAVVVIIIAIIIIILTLPPLPLLLPLL